MILNVLSMYEEVFDQNMGWRFGLITIWLEEDYGFMLIFFVEFL